MHLSRAVAILAIALNSSLMSGCVTPNINKSENISDDLLLSVDAKQRIVAVRKNRGGTSDADNDILQYCAEPSPDALSALSAGLSGGFFKPNATEIRAAQSFSESASNIGLRTQSIQLLRDAMYRVCEAYFNGAISVTDVSRILMRYQDTMVAILAIEQLTGVVTPRQVVLGGTASASIGSDVVQLTEALGKARQLEATRKTELDVIEKNEPSSGDKSQWEKDHSAAKSSHSEAAQAVKSLEDALDSANKRLYTASTATGQSYVNQTTVQLSDTSAKHISDAVTDIVRAGLFRNDFIETCISLIKERHSLLAMKSSGDKSVGTMTISNLITQNDEQSKKLACDTLLEAYAKSLTRCPNKEDTCDKP